MNEHARLPELAIRNLGHRFVTVDAEHLAIASIDLEILNREFLSIVGPSGCGKTTLLKCLAGLIRPTSGDIILRGTTITRVPPDVAVVFQDYSRSLYPWLTVRKNVEFPLTRNFRLKEERARRARIALEAVGLAHTVDRYPWQLSGGMQQRVAIARALAYEPLLLLMDEPFAALDAQTREDLEDVVLGIKERFGVTIVFVTHDIDESVYLSDRVVVLSASPARILADIPIDLPRPRDQIGTRALSEFVQQRSRIASLIRSQKVAPIQPSASPEDEALNSLATTNAT